MEEPKKRVATYARVSTDEQKQRMTIGNQTEALARYEQTRPDAEVLDRFEDPGISGTVPFAERPAGRRLLANARAGKYDEVWVTRADRLGRDAPDMLALWKTFKELRVRPVGVQQSIESYLSYGIQALFADDEHETIRSRLEAGIERWASEGCYVGGVVPVGYVVVSRDKRSYLSEDTTVVWGSLSWAGIVRMIYRRLAIDRWSCRRIAQEFNKLGIPTSDERNRRGTRAKATQPRWRPGRVRNLVVNPVYRGVIQFGRRSQKAERPVIQARCERLVSDEIWHAAQDTLAANRLLPKNTKRTFLLRGVMKCAHCGLAMCGLQGRPGVVWYRCNGKIAERGSRDRVCPSKNLKGEYIEPDVWADIDGILRNSGEVIAELAADLDAATERAGPSERECLQEALAGLGDKRSRVLDLFIEGLIPRVERDRRLDALLQTQLELEAKLAELEPSAEDDPAEAMPQELLDEAIQRLDAGLSAEERQEIVSIMVKRITVHTVDAGDGSKSHKVVIEYRAPRVASTCSGTGSWPPPA